MEGGKLENENMLVEQAKTDDNAFEALYDFYFPKIYFFVLKRTGQKETAEDIVSATFIKVFTGLKSFKPNNENSFAAWVYRIANNKLTDYYRQHARQVSIDIEEVPEIRDYDQDPYSDLIKNADRIIVKKALLQLPVRDQQILQLKFFAELDNKEIAKIMDTKPNNVGVWLFRALKRFEAIYQKYE